MKSVYTLVIIMATTTFSQAYEYLYPVGHSIHDGFSLLLLYQKSVHHIELWHWHPQTQEARKALLSMYTPVGIALLPEGRGFSFIDNDTIRVAYVDKRSPKLIPLYEPLYDFTTVHWFDTKHCILSAKENERYGIYCIDVEGQCVELLSDKGSDFRYPNLIDNQLFYITVCNGHYTIHQGIIDLTRMTHSKNVTREELFSAGDTRIYCPVEHEQTIIDCNTRYVAFLTMIDHNNGFYLEHPASIERHDPLISFDYHAITKQDNLWNDITLFSFSIPTAFLLDPKERLYESILPFLPKLIHGAMYYCHCELPAITTQLWRYDMQTHNVEQLTQAHHSVMGVYVFDNVEKHALTQGWYGGVLQDDPHVKNELPKAWVDNQGQFCVHMPHLEIIKQQNT